MVTVENDMRVPPALRHLFLSIFTALCLGAALCACGQKGPLYLPADKPQDSGQH